MAKKMNAKMMCESQKKQQQLKHAESRRRQVQINQQKQQEKQKPQESMKAPAAGGWTAAGECRSVEEQLKRLNHKPRDFSSLQPPDPELAKEGEIRFDEFALEIRAESPLHLGSGRADVNVDAEIVHDRAGLPYFPGKRLKGLIYESALEVLEMSEASGLQLFTEEELRELFQHGMETATQIILPNLYIEQGSAYRKMEKDWLYLEDRYPDLVSAEDVLSLYTSLRYQTKIDSETGTAAETSLRNIRVADEGLVFRGTVRLKEGTKKKLTILALALRNLSHAGMKRNRGFGRISCMMLQEGKNIRDVLIAEAWKGGRA
ncbi:RAMP superfamily CRISPR-associated protein [Selenomonas sputigena]|uniref:RAMP superfamily CRISPR-associated protein n=1 Tax=Selenomonas sputigena TaxID=69823 RepID=A0ABV3X7Z9_9FIRM